jgi:hypothetical protein
MAGAGALALASLLLIVSGKGSAADEKSTAAVPDKEVDQLIAQSTATVRDGLAGNVSKVGALKAHTAAVMIAAFAQEATGGLTPARVSTRDAALRLADLIKDEKFDQAKQALPALTKPGPSGGKQAKVKILGDKIELEDLMGQFGSPRSGGLGIEKKLEDLAEAKSLPPGSVDELVLVGARAAVVAEMAKPHDPGKKQKQWADFATAMQQEATAMAAAARNKDAAKTLAAAQRLNKSCTNCHDVFK